MEIGNINILIKELSKLPVETGWLELKQNNCDPKMIGGDLSALANSAVISDHSQAYMVWGVDDNSHEIVGTKVRLHEHKIGNEELENWLIYRLSKNASFEIHTADIEGKHVELIIISKAEGLPVSFEKEEYVRVGSYTKKLRDYPAIQTQLWDKLRQGRFEETFSKTGLTLSDALKYLNISAYFDLLHIPEPDDINDKAHPLIEEGIIARQDDGRYAITNLGAVLLSKKLSDFPRLGRKALRIVQYDKTNRLTILKEETIDEGYAISLEKAIKYVCTLIPSKEDINAIQRTTIYTFPLPAIREAIANSLIHQDFFLTGAGPVVEIFENRIEVTNPGTPLVDVMRIIDNPPKSRNEKLASLLRRFGMCEELGRGWDRIALSCELQQLPAPRIDIYQESTRVSIFSHIEFPLIQNEEKLWATYIHACIKYIEGSAMTNSTLRERFGLRESSSGSVSRLIKEACSKQFIKPLDPATAPRYMKYIPSWG